MAELGDVRIKRVYDPTGPEDGFRVLVDSVWPRGMKKEDMKADVWMKDVTPSSTLRKWFCHDPEKFGEFRVHYIAELAAHPKAVRPLLDALEKGPVTLLYAAHDPEHNHALVLREFLLSMIRNGDKG